MNAIHYVVQKEAHGYSVWTASVFTGSKQACCGFFNSKRDARRFIAREYARYEIVFRIHTEDRPNLRTLVGSRVQAFTLLQGVGMWKGVEEPAAVVEIIGTGADRANVMALAGLIRDINRQQAVYVTETPVHLHKIEA